MLWLRSIAGFVILIGLLGLTGALGVFEPMTKAVGYFAFVGCPLLWGLLHAYLFYKSAHAHGMPGTLIAATGAALVALTVGPLAILAHQIAAGLALIVLGIALSIVAAGRAQNLAPVFKHEDLNWNGNNFPAAPASKFATLATVQVILGIVGILFVRFGSTIDDQWTYYGPLALLAACGAILQIFWLKARAVPSEA